jgi:hypothetical protein
MIISLFIALPIAVLISGIIWGSPRKTKPEKYLFWLSCVGLVLYACGYIGGLIGDQIHRKTYNEPFSMGPISEIAAVILAAGVLLAVISIGFQIAIGAARLTKMISGKDQTT